MAYLARTESSSASNVTGIISWKFQIDNSNLVIDSLSFVCQSATFENGKVLWKISDGIKVVSYPSGTII